MTDRDTGSPTGAAASPGPIGDDGYKWRAFTAVGSFFVTAVLGLTMVFVALPTMAADFGVTLRLAGWILIAPSLTISALLLPFGRLADLVGRRRIHLTGLALFGVGAILTATAPTFAWLLVARVIMSIGGALTESVGTGILVSVFPSHERGRAIGLQSSSVAAGAAAGPLAAGIALQFLSWRALFWFLAALTAVSYLIGQRVLDERRITPTAAIDPDAERDPFDWPGAILSGLLVILVVLTVNNPFGLPWRSWPLAVAAGASALVLVAFIRRELATDHPMLQLRFFANRVFRLAVICRTLGFQANTALFLLLPILLVSVTGVSETRAGLAVFVNSVGFGLAAHVSGQLSDRFGTRPFMVSGFLVMAGAMTAFALMDGDTPLVLVASVALVTGIATGTWNPPNNATVIGTVPPASYGVVGAFTNLARNAGNVFGQALATAIVAATLAARGFDVPLGEIGDTPGASEAFVDGWRTAFTAMAALSLVAAVLATTIRTSSAEPR